MRREVDNRNRDCEFNGPYAGRDMYITMYQDSEREFVVTHNADIKPVSYFTGRETELEELRQRIEEGRKSVLVSGMGGIGKTHICRKLFEEYLNRHAKGGNEPFRHIGYIEYAGDMGSSLQRCLKFKKQERQEDNLAAAWKELEYLAADGKLLLFVDNVNMTIVEDAGLGRLKKIPGAVVLTTRRTSFSKEFEPYRIGFLNMEQCKEIYRFIRYEGSEEKVPEEQIPDLEYIIGTQAAGHTMTIELLAHLACTKLWTTKDLRDKLTDKGFQLEYRDDEDKLVNIQKSYEVLYDLSELNKAEQNILEAFSVFPYIPLEAKICNQWLLEDAGVGEEDDILVGLYRKGWLQFDIGQESYALHPVFAKFICERQKPKSEEHLVLIKKCKGFLEASDTGSIFECQKYVLFAENIIDKVEMSKSEGKIEFIASVGYLMINLAKYQKACEFYKHCLELCKVIFGEWHCSTASSYHNLAYVYEKQGEYRKAEELYEKSLRINKRVIGEKNPYTILSYNNLAMVYDCQGKYKEAEEMYKKSLSISEKVLGEEYPLPAVGYNNLAGLYKIQGRYTEAEEMYKKSLHIMKNTIGEKHSETAIVYNNLAELYKCQGKYKEAVELYIKSLQIKEKTLGKEHPDTAIIYNGLAVAYVHQGKYKEAEELCKKALKIWKEVFGEKQQIIAIVYNNLASIYQNEGEYEKAEILYRKALLIEEVSGENHPDTIITYGNLATVCESQGKYWEAEEMYNKSLQIGEKVLGDEHPDTVIIYGNLAGLYESQEKYKEAEEMYKKCLRIDKKVFGEEHPETVTSYNNLAALYADQGKYEEAVKLYKNCIKINEKVFGKEHSETAISYNNLAGVYYEQEKYEISLIYFYKAFSILVSKLGMNHPNTQIVCGNLEGIYTECNPEGNFEQWLEEKMKEADVD